MRILAIDPGPTYSAWVIYDTEKNKPIRADIWSNENLIVTIDGAVKSLAGCGYMVIEMPQSFGMPVGASVFDTCVWIGRFWQAFYSSYSVFQVFRKDIKLHLCGTSRAKDANVRAALIDRYGGSRQAAVGTKKNPGPLYGFKRDMWAALAVAVCFSETIVKEMADEKNDKN